MPVQKISITLPIEPEAQLNTQHQRRRPKESSVSNQKSATVWRATRPTPAVDNSEKATHDQKYTPTVLQLKLNDANLVTTLPEQIVVIQLGHNKATTLDPLCPIRAQKITKNTDSEATQFCIFERKTSISTPTDEVHQSQTIIHNFPERNAEQLEETTDNQISPLLQ